MGNNYCMVCLLPVAANDWQQSMKEPSCHTHTRQHQLHHPSAPPSNLPPPHTCTSLAAAAVASSTPPASPTAVPPSSPAEMGRPSSQVPPARNSGVAETKSREWVREVACTEYTNVPKCRARHTALAASRGACRGGWRKLY